jgi:putative flippase GtrA
VIARVRDLVAGLVRYGMVGVANAATYYATYLLALPHGGYLVAHAVGLGTAMVVSFFLNCRFTFRVRPTPMRFLLYPASQAVNVVATTVGVVGLVHLGVDERLAPLVAAALAVPVSFLAARLLLTRTGAPGPAGAPAPTPAPTAMWRAALDDPDLAGAVTRPLPGISGGRR